MGSERIEALVKNKGLLPRKQRILCDYILAHADTVSMMTVSNLAQASQVGEATIFRFLAQIGYESYAQFRQELHEYSISSASSSYWQMSTMLQHSKTSGPTDDVLASTFKTSVELLQKTLSPETQASFDRAIGLMLTARRVLLLGLRSSKSIALYFDSILSPFFDSVRQLSNDEHFIFDRISQMETGDLLFLITNWPYTKTSIDAARFCHEMGHPIILLTNSLSCSAAKAADVVLMTKSSPELYTRVPTLAMVEAISNELAKRLSPESGQKLERIDRVLHRYQLSEW